MSEIRVVKSPAKTVLASISNLEKLYLRDAYAIFRGSIGISEEDCAKLANTYCLAVYRDGRYHILSSASGAYGSINASSSCFKDEGSCLTHVKDMFCTACGTFLNKGQRHDCNAPKCSICGNFLTPYEAEHCGEFHHNACSGNICKACAAEISNKCHDYHRWHRDPEFSKPNRRADVLHMGTEWETQYRGNNRYDDASRVAATANCKAYHPDIHLENDGSISGVEFITEPKTLEDYVRADNLRAFLDKLVDNGFSVDGHNGAHIHLDREFFGKKNKTASAMIAYHVAVYWDNFWLPLSKRDPNNLYYCSKSSIVSDDEIIDAYDKARHEAGHSTAVNIANSGTIELRFWSGTLDYDEVLARFDISRALATWAKKTSVGKLPSCTIADVLKYIERPETCDYIRTVFADTAITSKLPY